MCDIWRATDTREFRVEQLEALLPSLDRLGTRWVVFTGGEPLMNSNLFRLCGPLRQRGIQISILSTGLLFERFAAEIVEHLDSAIVSIDGPPELHDSIRHASGGYRQIAGGIRAIRALRPRFPLAARTVVQRKNHAALTDTAAAAETLSLDSISFLAADLTSSAFNRAEPWPVLRQEEIAVPASELPRLDAQLELLSRNPFVADSPEHLSRIARHFRVYRGLEAPESPRCNAPWISAFVTAAGVVQPCFFHRPVGQLGKDSLLQVLEGPAARVFRRDLRVESNPICQRCVCSLHLRGGDGA
jgi:MoaA/NifB/PqqE/SkfB family radical SAM enzyme